MTHDGHVTSPHMTGKTSQETSHHSVTRHLTMDSDSLTHHTSWLVRCVVSFTVSAGGAVVVQSSLVPPQVRVRWTRCLPAETWTTHGYIFEKGFNSSRV